MTVTIQLTTAGIDTGSFSIFSNIDLVTPIVTGVSRASLLTGYAVVVPNSATSVIVKSNSTHCTNQVTIPISGITTTTTTTTVMCTTVTYGADPFDPQTACDNYYYAPEQFQWGGSTLYYYDAISPCNPLYGTVADPGYYSDGSSIWYWDGSGSFTYDSPCISTRYITIHAKRTGSITGYQYVKIVASEDGGTTWNVVTSSALLATSFNTTNQFTYAAGSGNNLWIGAVLSSSLEDIAFGAALSPTDSSCLNYIVYCGKPNIATVVSGSCGGPYAGPGAYNYGIVTADDDIYLNFPTFMTETSGYVYTSCTPY